MDITKYLMVNLLPLAVALFVIGKVILKPTELVPDKYIPLLLLVLGVIGAFGLLTVQNKVDVTNAVIQGVLAAGLAVLTDQIPKQLVKKE